MGEPGSLEEKKKEDEKFFERLKVKLGTSLSRFTFREVYPILVIGPNGEESFKFCRDKTVAEVLQLEESCKHDGKGGELGKESKEKERFFVIDAGAEGVFVLREEITVLDDKMARNKAKEFALGRITPAIKRLLDIQMSK